MTPPQEPRTGGGIPIWEILYPIQHRTDDPRTFTDKEHGGFLRDPFVAFPLAEAEALIDPNDRDNEWCEAITAEIPWEVDGDGDPMSSVADAVQSLRMQRDERIDPNDPAVRERLVASFDRSARAIFDYGMAGDGCDPQTLDAMRNDLLATLRSKP